MECMVKKTESWISCQNNVAALLVVLVCLIISGCAGDVALDDKEKLTVETEEIPVEKIYNSAVDYLESRKYSDAIEKFQNVERLHPYSVWATKAQLMSAFGQYQNNSYDEALLSLERFISLHPANKDVAYAYYLKALCYYEQISDVVRDQAMTQLALSAFKELLARFPMSDYGRDGKIKLDLIYDHLAGKEMEIGRYYHNKGSYSAAINRFKNVLSKYETTTHVPEALHRLSECFRALGLNEEANKMAAVLGFNFPSSDWYSDSYKMLKGNTIGNKVKKVEEPKKKSWYKFW